MMLVNACIQFVQINQVYTYTYAFFIMYIVLQFKNGGVVLKNISR